MPSMVTNYKCPSCLGPLHFVGASGKLECEYCGSQFTVKEIEQLQAGAEASAQNAFAQAEAREQERGSAMKASLFIALKTAINNAISYVNSNY